MQIRIQIIIAIISLGGVSICGIVSNIFMTMMVEEINRKKQKGNRVSYIGFTFFKMLRILNEYRLLYPGGQLYLYMRMVFALGMVCLVIVGACLYTMRP